MRNGRKTIGGTPRSLTSSESVRPHGGTRHAGAQTLVSNVTYRRNPVPANCEVLVSTMCHVPRSSTVHELLTKCIPVMVCGRLYRLKMVAGQRVYPTTADAIAAPTPEGVPSRIRGLEDLRSVVADGFRRRVGQTGFQTAQDGESPCVSECAH
jgi:hypothetical protein